MGCERLAVAHVSGQGMVHYGRVEVHFDDGECLDVAAAAGWGSGAGQERLGRAMSVSWVA